MIRVLNAVCSLLSGALLVRTRLGETARVRDEGASLGERRRRGWCVVTVQPELYRTQGGSFGSGKVRNTGALSLV